MVYLWPWGPKYETLSNDFLQLVDVCICYIIFQPNPLYLFPTLFIYIYWLPDFFFSCTYIITVRGTNSSLKENMLKHVDDFVILELKVKYQYLMFPSSFLLPKKFGQRHFSFSTVYIVFFVFLPHVFIYFFYLIFLIF